MIDKCIKPPLGIMPKRFHDEKRAIALQETISRYNEAGELPSQDWYDELNVLEQSLEGNKNYLAIIELEKLKSDAKNNRLKEDPENIDIK